MDMQIPGEVIVEFIDGATKEEALALIAEYGAELIRFNTGETLRMALVRVTPGEETSFLMAFLTSPLVILVDVNYQRRIKPY